MKISKTERKLEYFANAILNEANIQKSREKNEALAKHNRHIEDMLESTARRINVMMRAGQDEIIRSANRQISKAKVHAITQCVEARKQQIDRLFVDIQAKLASFSQEPEYETYMIQRIKQVKELNKNFAIIKLSPHDMRLENAIKTATGLAPEAGSHDYIGGFILLDAARKIRADYTFKTRLVQAKKRFCYDS